MAKQFTVLEQSVFHQLVFCFCSALTRLETHVVHALHLFLVPLVEGLNFKFGLRVWHKDQGFGVALCGDAVLHLEVESRLDLLLHVGLVEVLMVA